MAHLVSRWPWRLIILALAAAGGLMVGYLEHGRRQRAEAHLLQTRSRLQQVDSELQSERQRSERLAQALDEKSKQMERTAKRLEEEGRTVEQLRGRLGHMEEQISQLQAELLLQMRARESGSGNGRSKAGAVELEKIVVSPPDARQLQGHIVQVNADWRFVVVDLGWEDISIGDMLNVFRNGDLIARVQVERVQEQVAAARVLPEYDIDAIAVNDQVATR